MNLNLFSRKKKPMHKSKGDSPVYVSKLGRGKSTDIKKASSGVKQVKGVRRLKVFLHRCLEIVYSDIYVLCSMWKPRERIIYMKE